MKTEYILGIPVDVITLTDIITELPERLQQTEKTLYLSINPQIALHASNYPEVMGLIETASHRIPDGIGIVKASQQQGGAIKKRVTGIELMYQLLDYANQKSESIFLYGAKPEVLADTVKVIERDYPDLKIAGWVDGYTSLTESEIVAKINQVKPTFVFVALGFPRQEQWLARNYQAIDAQVFQDVGGSFDVISGHVKRSPQLFISLHLEWLYRSLSSPKRLYRLLEVPVFMFRSKKWYQKNKKR